VQPRWNITIRVNRLQQIQGLQIIVMEVVTQTHVRFQPHMMYGKTKSLVEATKDFANGVIPQDIWNWVDILGQGQFPPNLFIFHYYSFCYFQPCFHLHSPNPY
jgi:hypothetical protein